MNVGTKQKPVYIPAQFCTLLNAEKINNSELTYENLRGIVGAATIHDMVKEHPSIELCRLPGLKMSADMLKNGTSIGMTADMLVPSRTLRSPQISYEGSGPISTTDGAWEANQVVLSKSSAGMKVAILNIVSGNWNVDEMLKGKAKPSHQDMLSIDAKENEIQKRIKILEDALNETKATLCTRLSCHGVALEQNIRTELVKIEEDKLDSKLRDQVQKSVAELSKAKPKAILVILPELGNKKDSRLQSLYDFVKFQADIKSGIQTICVVSKFFKNDNGYFSQIGLKLNLKAGHPNQVLQAQNWKYLDPKTTMIVGLDTLIAPAKARKGARDVVAAVVSSEGRFFKWLAGVKVVGDEPINKAIQKLLEGRLAVWKEANNSPPKNVIIYRNGMNIRDEKACFEEIAIAQKVLAITSSLTFIAVNKDHRAKIRTLSSFGKSDNDATVHNDSMLIRSAEDVQPLDFVIQNRQVRKSGTAKTEIPAARAAVPVRYSVLMSSLCNKPGARDELENLTYDMCYLSGCCTSMVTNTLPIHYVRLLCDRIRSWVRPWYYPKPNYEPEGREMDQSSVQPHRSIENSMFYV